jgi:hemerythrin superfamily protein
MATKKKKTARPDAIARLKEDHQKVRKLLDQLEKSNEKSGDRRTKLLAQIEQELKVHTTIEEEIFYPAYKAAAEKKDEIKLFHEAAEEHGVVDMFLPKMHEADPGSVEFSARAKVLKDLVEHHAGEEEKEMFPKARKLMDRAELVELGDRLAARKRQLQRA